MEIVENLHIAQTEKQKTHKTKIQITKSNK
jgi:hypothetical protein